MGCLTTGAETSGGLLDERGPGQRVESAGADHQVRVEIKPVLSLDGPSPSSNLCKPGHTYRESGVSPASRSHLRQAPADRCHETGMKEMPYSWTRTAIGTRLLEPLNLYEQVYDSFWPKSTSSLSGIFEHLRSAGSP